MERGVYQPVHCPQCGLDGVRFTGNVGESMTFHCQTCGGSFEVPLGRVLLTLA